MRAPTCSPLGWCSMRWLRARVCAGVRLGASLPAELERIVSKCLESDRELRYQHASEIRADLQRLKRDTDSGRAPAGAKPGLPQNAGRC